jgi:hypothetical protein
MCRITVKKGKKMDHRKSQRIGFQLHVPHFGKCEQCQTEFVLPLILIFDVDGDIPKFVEERRIPSHLCSTCGAITVVFAPLLAVNLEDKPHLIFVSMENTSREDNLEALNYVLERLRSVMSGNWHHEWVQEIEFLDRDALASFIERRRKG